MPLIMIVEDDRTLREGLCRALCDEYDMAPASGVNEARALVGRLTPDLVLLDCELPDGNGID
ncbi:MAG: response regulator, partial [Candidatus Flemingiibacterium sp.]